MSTKTVRKSVKKVPASGRFVASRSIPKAESSENLQDLREAERRLADPNEVPIPYEQARRKIGLF